MRAVSSVKRIVGRDGDSRVELTLWNKPRALELAAKHLGMFGPDRIELDATPRMSLAFARAVVELGEQYRVQAGISPLNSGEVRRMVLGADATPDDAEPDASEPS